METRYEDRAEGRPAERGRPAVRHRRQSLPQLDHEIRILRTRRRTTYLTAWIEAVDARAQRIHPDKRLLSALDGRDFVFDNEALARRCRANARLLLTVP